MWPIFADNNDLIRISVHSAEIDYSVQLPFVTKEQLSADMFLAEVERVLQSYEEFTLEDAFEISIVHVINKQMFKIRRISWIGLFKKERNDNSIRRGRGIQGILANELGIQPFGPGPLRPGPFWP